MSLFRVVSEAANANPNASPQVIGEAVMRAIELSLPEIFMNVKVPSTPSQFALRRRELQRNRTPKRVRSTIQQRAVEEETISRELAFLQRVFDGTSSTAFAGWDSGSDWDARPPGIANVVGASNAFSRIANDKEIDYSEMLPSIPLGLGPFPSYSTITTSKPEARFAFTLDPTAQRRLVSNPVLFRFLSTVESAIRIFAESYRLAWNFDISLPPDIEEPSWNKIVLRLKPTQMTYGEKVELWDRIDSALRETIDAALISPNLEDSKAYTALNRNLFLEMDLSE